MATKVKRRTVSSYLQKAHSYLWHRHEIKQLEAPRDLEKKWLKTYIEDNGYTDPESGNIQVAFDEPLAVYGKKTYGMELRKIPGAEFFDQDEVEKFLYKRVADLNLSAEDIHKVFREVTTVEFDQNELYVLQQEGKITEKDLRKLIHVNDPTYQLWPIENPLPDND